MLRLVEDHSKFPGPVRTLPPEAQAIRAARRALGLTQAQFAARHGVDETTVRRWESGRHESKLARAIAIDGAFVLKIAA